MRQSTTISVIDYRAWGSIGLIVTFLWQLYTLWILVNLHESPETGMRYSRYLQLSTFTFGMNSNLTYHLFDKMPQPRKLALIFTRKNLMAQVES